MSNLIVVSGFGPFRKHEKVNASWEAVKHLPDEVDFAGKKFPIRKIEIPVEYAEVEKTVQEIWKLNPMVSRLICTSSTHSLTSFSFQLVIHCGVHGKIQRINVELMARNGNFCESDYSGQRLGCTTTTLTNNGSSCESLQTRFDVNKIVNELNDACGDNRFYCSDDVGK